MRIARVARACLGMACGLLAVVAPSTVRAAPVWELEGGVQTLRTVRGDTEVPVGFPISGFGAVGVRPRRGEHFSWVVKCGYDDAASRNRLDRPQPAFGDPVPDREALRMQSLVVPVRLVAQVHRSAFVEFGPEWRRLLRATARDYRADSAIPEQTYVATEAYRRDAFALSTAVGFEWAALGGRARVALRWLATQGNASRYETRFRPRAAQLALGWRQ